MRALNCKMRPVGIMNGLAIIRNAYWWIRYTAPVKTEPSVKNMR